MTDVLPTKDINSAIDIVATLLDLLEQPDPRLEHWGELMRDRQISPRTLIATAAMYVQQRGMPQPGAPLDEAYFEAMLTEQEWRERQWRQVVAWRAGNGR